MSQVKMFKHVRLRDYKCSSLYRKKANLLNVSVDMEQKSKLDVELAVSYTQLLCSFSPLLNMKI